MNSEDWRFLMNVSKRVHGEHDGRNSYKYNNKDKEWINYVKKYSNGKSGESDEIHNDKNIDYIEMFYVSSLIGCILFIITSVIFDIKW